MKEITFEDLQIANESIKSTDIKGKEYAEVPQRVKAFRMVYPRGCIETFEEYLDGMVGNRVVGFTANVYDEEHKLLASGFAEEKESSSYINKTSFIENCETSAVGRALGFAGFGIDTSIASYEEVANAINNQNKGPQKITEQTWKELNSVFVKDEIKQMFIDQHITNGRDMLQEYAQKKIDERKQDETKEFY